MKKYRMHGTGEFMSPVYLTLFLVLAILKLAEVVPFAAWSWWWITAPLWAPLLITIAGLIFFGIMALLVLLINRPRK